MIPIPAFILGLVLLLLVATISAIIMKKVNFPYTIGLVVVGFGFAMVCSAIPGLEQVRQLRLNHDIILYVLLPTLIFDASVNINTRMLKKNLVPVMALAAPGLVISTVAVGAIMAWLTPLSLGEAMIFGALISATDPVAVISLFEIVGAPLRLRVLVDGESLFNDATAIVVFNIISKIVLTGGILGMSALASGSIEFCVVFLGGLAVGAVIGYIMMTLIQFADNDPLIEVALSTIVAYTAFIIADKAFDFSGVMSVLGAGIVISHYGSTRFTPKVRQYMKQFWSLLTFIANSFIFLLLGFTEDSVFYSINKWGPVFTAIVWAVVAIQVARGVVVFGIVPFLGWWRKEYKTSWGYQTVMFWGGLRGAVPLALVFSLPDTLPHRNLIIQITLGVVLFTLLVQGTTIRKLMEFFKLDKPNILLRGSKIKAMIAARSAGMENINRLRNKGEIPGELLDEFEQEYKKKIDLENLELDRLRQDPEYTDDMVFFTVMRDSLAQEMKTYSRLFEEGFIGENVYRQLEFHVCQRQDQCSDGVNPVFTLEGSPLEMRMSRLINRFLKRVLPNSGILFSRQVKDALEDYMCAIAVIIAAADVDKTLVNLEKLYDKQTKAIEFCRKFYQDFRKAAIDNLTALEQNDPELLKGIERTAVHQAFYGTEMETIEQLAVRGELDEESAEELIEDIRDKVVESNRTLYKMYSAGR